MKNIHDKTRDFDGMEHKFEKELRWNDLVEEYQTMLYRIAFSNMRNRADAEDAVQEAFLRYMKDEKPILSKEHEKAWLIRTTLQRASDIRRKAEQRNVPLEDVTEPVAPESPGEELRSAVRALPEMYGAVIHLHYYEGYSIKEIAKLLGLPAATVGTRLARGRERLRQMLKEDVV